MSAFRKKPVVIDAVENDGTWQTIIDWLDSLAGGHMSVPFGARPAVTRNEDGTLNIETLEGTHLANLGDYVICGVAGELYPCKPDIFDATYEAVAEGTEAPLSVALDDVVGALRKEGTYQDNCAADFIEREFGSPEGGDTE